METMGAEGSMSFLPPGTAVRDKTVGGFVGEPVDLGLSVRWASWNVGACRPGEAGAYFAWGEVQGGERNYGWATYRHLSQYDGADCDDWKHINKYQADDGLTSADWYDSTGAFTGDGKTTLEKSDDAASVNWGGVWRMPTAAELDELSKKCTWEWKEAGEYESGSLPGYLVTGPNGNSIFLPAAGVWWDSDLCGLGSLGNYWSSGLDSGKSRSARYLNRLTPATHDCRDGDSGKSHSARYLNFRSGLHDASFSCIRYPRLSVRAVCQAK